MTSADAVTWSGDERSHATGVDDVLRRSGEAVQARHERRTKDRAVVHARRG